MTPPGPFIKTLVLADAPSVPVVRVELGLTLYLADTVTWARTGAARALELFLERAPRERLSTFTTSQMTHWRPVEPDAHADLVKALSPPWWDGKPRHLFTFELADNAFAPSVGFTYREVDYARNQRAGVLELTLPQQTDPEVLARLAEETAGCGPFFCGVGGYAARWYPARRQMAFDHLCVWCHRYWGLDIQDPGRFSWNAERELPGSNWLTLLGPGLIDARRLELQPLLRGEAAQGVRALQLAHGVLVRAGEATLGDLNQLEVPGSYLESARWLAPAFAEAPPMLDGPFTEEGRAKAWQRRFLEPADWKEPP